MAERSQGTEKYDSTLKQQTEHTDLPGEVPCAVLLHSAAFT